MSNNIQTFTELYECMRRPLDSVNLRRFFLMLIRAHWTDRVNHGALADFLDCMHYDEEPKDRTLDVELSHTFDPEKGSRRPGIYVGFGGVQLKTIGIGGSVERRPDNSARTEGKKAETMLKIGHINQSADMALMMAESNATLLQGIHKDIIANMDVLDMQVIGWSEPQLMEKAPDRNFQVDLQCAVSFNFMVEIDIESHRIKKFGTEFNATAC